MKNKILLDENQKNSLSNNRHRIKSKIWNVMLNADAMNRELNELVDYMADYDLDINSSDILETMALLQEVRARCGVQVESLTTPMDLALENYYNSINGDLK